jgi:hypothetical protein
MVATLNNCQEVMKKYSVPEEEIDNVQSTLAVSQQHASEHDDEIDPSKWPSASNQQQPQTPSRPSKENKLQLQRSAPPRQQTQQAPAQHQAQQHQERPTSFPPTFIVMDENVRAMSPQAQQDGYRSSSPPPPAPMPLQRNTASPATAGMYGSNTSVSSGNALHASRDSNSMFDSRLSAHGSNMYSSQNGYGGYGYAVGSATPQQQQQPRPGSQQCYREAEAVL